MTAAKKPPRNYIVTSYMAFMSQIALMIAMARYADPPTFRMAQTCHGCGKAQLRGVNETLEHFMARPRCPRCRGKTAKNCQWCGCQYERPYRVSYKAWRARIYCDKFCASRGTAPIRSQTMLAPRSKPGPDTPSAPSA